MRSVLLRRPHRPARFALVGKTSTFASGDKKRSIGLEAVVVFAVELAEELAEEHS